MLYDLAIVIYDFIVHLAAPFSRKPRKMMKGHWVVYEPCGSKWRKGNSIFGFMLLHWESLNKGVL